MKQIADITRILDSRELAHHTYEVCALALAAFDEKTSTLTVRLDNQVRRVNPRGADTLIHPPWLPAGETIRHHSPEEEAADEAREIFHSWADKVKRSIPGSEEFAAGVALPRDEVRPVDRQA